MSDENTELAYKARSEGNVAPWVERALASDYLRLRAKFDAITVELAEEREKSECGHPSACIVHEQGPEDADEVCRWCAEVGAAAQVSEYEKGLLTDENEKLNLIVKAARLFAEFWREDAIKTGRGLLLIERLDEYDAAAPAPAPIVSGARKPDCSFCGESAEDHKRPCGNCGDEGHAKWECCLPETAPLNNDLKASKLGSNQGSEAHVLRDSLTVQVGQSERDGKEA